MNQKTVPLPHCFYYTIDSTFNGLIVELQQLIANNFNVKLIASIRFMGEKKKYPDFSFLIIFWFLKLFRVFNSADF